VSVSQGAEDGSESASRRSIRWNHASIGATVAAVDAARASLSAALSRDDAMLPNEL